MNSVSLTNMAATSSVRSESNPQDQNFSRIQNEMELGPRIGASASDSRQATLGGSGLGKHLILPTLLVGGGAVLGAILGVVLLSNPLLLFGGAAFGMAIWGALYLTHSASMREGAADS